MSDKTAVRVSPRPVVPEVCLLERDAAIGSRLMVALERGAGASVTVFERAEALLDHVARHPVDVVVAAGDLADNACPALLRQIQLRHPQVIRVVVTDRDAADVFPGCPTRISSSSALRPRAPSGRRWPSAWM